MNFSAVILAGGKSSRMGRDKAWLKIRGETLLARQIRVVREAGAAEVFISGRADANYAEFGCRVLRDKFAGAGPLAGIERALAAAAAESLLVLAVDLPAMNAAFLGRLMANGSAGCGIIPRVAGNIEPLAAVYPKLAHLMAESLLSGHQNAVATFARHCVQSGLAQFADLPAGEAGHFANWNSPADLSSGVAKPDSSAGT